MAEEDSGRGPSLDAADAPLGHRGQAERGKPADLCADSNAAAGACAGQVKVFTF